MYQKLWYILCTMYRIIIPVFSDWGGARQAQRIQLMNLSEHLVSWGISDGGACFRVNGENKWLELPICSPSSAQASPAMTSSEDELARRGSDSSKVGERPDALRRLPDCYHCATHMQI